MFFYLSIHSKEASKGQRSLDDSDLKSELPDEPVNIHGHVMEVNDIVQALSDNSSKAVAVVLVSGISGIGKTTVAIQASIQLTSKHGSIVKFCSLRCVQSGEESGDYDESKGERELREILNVCVPGHQQTNENPRHVLLNWCRRLEREMILVLDNAEDAMEEDVKDFFTDLLKDMRKCSQSKLKFLITSRRSDIDRATGLNVKDIQLGPLDLEESIEVLKCNAKLESKSEQPRDNLQQIAELCEHIPLALQLAAHLLSSESEYTVEELVQRLQNDPTKTLGRERIMEIAFEKLDESLQVALVCLSVFVRSFDRNAAKALLGIKCAEYLTKLKERCLIQKQDDRYLIHLLIRSYARQVGRENFPQILAHGQQAFLEYFLSLILSNAKTYWGKDTCKESFDLFNAERLNYESTLRDFSNRKIRNCRQLEDVVNDCRLVAPYIGACVPINLYENFLTGLLQFAEDQEKVIHRVEILCLRYNEGRKRGGARKELQDEAIKLHDENSHLFEQNGLSEVFYSSHFARYLLQDCDRGEEGQPVLKKALAVYENELKPESFEKENPESTYDVARILGQMGHYAKTQGRTEEACENYLEALRLLKNGFGNHILTAFAHKDVADSYLFVDQYSKAEENYQKAMAILEDMQKANHREAIPVFKNWGICFEKSCKFVESREKYEKGSRIAENTIEGNHKWKVWINTYLALLLYTRYPEDASTASRIASEVLQMGKELELNGWPRKKELEEMGKTHETI